MSEKQLYRLVNGQKMALTEAEKEQREEMKRFAEEQQQRELCADIRKQRNELLKDSDVMLLRLLECGDMDQELAKYRQDLRDVPEQAGFPDDISWPSYQFSLTKGDQL